MRLEISWGFPAQVQILQLTYFYFRSFKQLIVQANAKVSFQRSSLFLGLVLAASIRLNERLVRPRLGLSFLRFSFLLFLGSSEDHVVRRLVLFVKRNVLSANSRKVGRLDT